MNVEKLRAKALLGLPITAKEEGYDKGFDEQKAEIERLKAENAKLLNAIEDFTAKKCCLKCDIARILVKEFADKLKQKARGLKFEDGEGGGFYFENVLLTSDINELIKEYEIEK